MVADERQESTQLAKRIGKRIADRRKQLAWTQEQLAERTRVDAETISRFERGVNLPSLPTLDRLATVLKVEVGHLLSSTEPAAVEDAVNLSALLEGLHSQDRMFITQQINHWVGFLRDRRTSSR
jgi:transcriptional regulator with XRE-family HTH domain